LRTSQLRRYRSALLVACAFAAGAVLAQSQGGDFKLSKSVISGGGAVAQAGSFRVAVTTGQHDAATSRGGGFVVKGGFWPQAGAFPSDMIFCNGFESPSCSH
jgi:hypothetical protein